MTDEAEVEALLRRMRMTPPLPEPDWARAERISARLDERLAGLMAEDARRARLLRWLRPVAAAAALLLLVGAGWFAVDRVRSTQSQVLASPFEVLQGQLQALGELQGTPNVAAREYRVGKDAASIVLRSGTRVQLAGETTFGLNVETEKSHVEDLLLPAGKISLSVPKLGERRLTVRTHDALVTVRGTQFSVEASAAPNQHTRVTVLEGSVEVRAASEIVMLGPGDVWESPKSSETPAQGSAPADNSDPAVTSAAVEPATGTATAATPAATAPRATGALPARTADASSLRAENKLFQAAAAAKARGDFPTALGFFNELLEKYPNSPLAHNTEVERFRTLQAMHQDQAAARAAREYLSRHADGFARTEAKNLALRPVTGTNPGATDGK